MESIRISLSHTHFISTYKVRVENVWAGGGGGCWFQVSFLLDR